MSLLYKVSEVKSHFDPAQKPKYIARPCKRNIIDTDEMSRIIADRSTLSRADIAATLYAFEELIPELLLGNYSLHLKPLGIFSLSFKSKAEDDVAKVNAGSITDIKLQFRPDAKLKKELKKAKLQKG